MNAIPTTAPAPDAKPYRLYSHSTIVYWWPVWLVGFLMAAWTYLDGGYMAWVPAGAEARRDWPVVVAPGRVEPREGLLLPAGGHTAPTRAAGPEQALPEAEQPHVRMAHGKLPGYIFAVTVLLVLLHTGTLARGWMSYFVLAAVGLVVLAVALADVYAPELGVLRGVRYLLFDLFDIRLSSGAYLAVSLGVFAIWCYAYFAYDHYTYMTFAPGQVHVVEEIGEGETIIDSNHITFERKRDDFFRHQVLGLGAAHWLLNPLVRRVHGAGLRLAGRPGVRMIGDALRRYAVVRLIGRLLGWLLHPLAWFGGLLGHFFWTTGAGDLVFRIGGPSARIIEWPNVLDIDRRIKRVETMLATKRTVAGPPEKEEPEGPPVRPAAEVEMGAPVGV